MSNIVIVRYQTHGKRFEVPCFRNRVDEYFATGRETSPANIEKIVAFPAIFFNCHRKQQATHSSLQEAFHTTDFSTIATLIVQCGELMMNDKDRVERRAEQRDYLEKVYHLTQLLLRNRFTGEPPEFADVREEVLLSNGASLLTSSTSVTPHPLAFASFFASWVVSRGNLFCDRVTKKRAVRCSLTVEEEWNDFFLLLNGVLLPLDRSVASADSDDCTLTFLYDAYLDQDNALTRSFHELLSKCLSSEEVSPTESEIAFFSRQDVQLPQVSSTAADCLPKAHQTEQTQIVPKRKSQLSDDEEPHTASSVSKYESMTHKQLQDLCRQKKLSTGGKKHDLIDRLEALDDTPLPKKKRKDGE